MAELVGDNRVIDLLGLLEEDRSRLSSDEKSEIIIKLFGAQNILFDKTKRNALFLGLSQSEAEDLAAYLSVSIEDLESFRLTPKKKEELLSYFEVEVEEIIDGNDVEDSQVVNSTIEPQYGLFPHQSRALFKCRDYLEGTGKQRVMLHMPTGSGKTRTATHLICRHLNNRHKGLVLWLAHSKELCDQAAEELSDAWAKLGERKIEFNRFYGGDSNELSSDLNDGIVVAGLHKAWHFVKRSEPRALDQFAQNISLIVFDEAHQSVANTYKQMVDIFTSSNDSVGLLGLSATPGRSHYEDDTQADSPLIDLFEGQKVTLEVEGYDSPVHYLQEKGYLAKVSYKKIPYLSEALDESLQEKIREGIEREFNITDECLEELGLDAQRNLEIVRRTEELISDGHKRVILFSPSVYNSDLIAAILKTRGINAESITTKSGEDSREEKVQKYKDVEDVEPMVLCNYGILTTGFDAPRTSAVIIARPTNSVVLYSQMVGRAIRGEEVKGNKKAEVHTVMDTSIDVFCDLVTQFENWDQQWKTNN